MTPEREQEWKQAFANCIDRLLKATGSMRFYLSHRGMPSTIPGVGYTEVGTYTPAVTIEQLAEDFREAERQRTRHYA